MKKLLKRFLFTFIAVVSLLIIFSLIKVIYVSSAKADFKAQRYRSAAQKYNLLLKLEPNNSVYKHELANNLVKLELTYENQSLICDFLEKYEDESYAYMLEERLKKLRSALDVKIGPNYVDKVPMGNQIIRWEDDAFPLMVYMTGGDEAYQSVVKKAFDYWTYASRNFFSFAYTKNEKDADIIVEIAGSAKSNCTGSEECMYILAYTAPEIKHDILKNMVMIIYAKDPAGNSVPLYSIYETTLHEIGHALGIMGHSENPENLMYSSGKNNESEYFRPHRTALSSQDINTLRYLYMIVPNISNIPRTKHNTKNKVHPNIILGTTKQMKKRDIENALKYVQTAPNLSIGYFDLGDAYVQSERYKDALYAYQKGFNLSSEREEKYNFVYRMAITCIKMKDRKKALEYAQYAQKIYPTDEVKNLIHDIKYPLSLRNSEY